MTSCSKSTDSEFPKVDVLSKPVVTPRPVISRPASPPAVDAPSIALDLGELRKTQKRVAFLLEKCSQEPGDRYPIFPRPTYEGKCFLCRNNIGDPHTHYQPNRTEGGNPTHVVPGRTRRNSIIIPSEWGSRGKQGDRSTPHLPDANSSSAGNENIRKNATLPHITEKQTVSGIWRDSADETNKHGRRHKNKKDVPMYTTENGFKGLIPDTDQGRMKKRGVIITNLTGVGSWVEATSDDDWENGGLGKDIHPERFQNSRRTDRARVDTPTGGTRTGRFFQFDPKKNRQTREGSVKLSKWCECESSGAVNECRECGRIGGHEQWCRFEKGECPDCGKPVKGKRHVKFRSVSTPPLLSPSPSNISGSTDGSKDSTLGLTNRARSTGYQRETSKSKGGKRRKRKTKRVSINARHHSSVTESRIESTIDANIHRQAYILALADAKLRQWKSDSWMFQNSARSVCFSYFSLWRNPHTRSDSESESKCIPRIGIRGREVKPKIKNPMKHILGSIKLSDYYPSGKRFPKKSETLDY